MLSGIKSTVKNIPILGSVAISIATRFSKTSKLRFQNSAQYWEDRYKLGGNSGSGSYNQLAAFKAEIINAFIEKHGLNTIVEFGCGDGEQLKLASYPKYVGFDVAPTSVEMCKEKFSHNENYNFFLVGGDEYNSRKTYDVALSLDVIQHLIEDEVYEAYMKNLFSASDRFVIIYAYSFEKIYASKHERGRDFLAWIHENIEDWRLLQKIDNRYPYDPKNPSKTTQADFYIFEKSN